MPVYGIRWGRLDYAHVRRLQRPGDAAGYTRTPPRPPTVVPMKRLLLGLIRLYQLCLSPFFGGQCRFWPSCSVYAAEAVDRHGVLAGSWLAVKRLLRCHPWHPGGVDEVPPRRDA